MNNSEGKSSKLKIFLGLFISFLLIGGSIGFYFYNQVFGTNLQLTEDAILTIPSNSTIESLAQKLQDEKVILNANNFVFTANQMSYKPKTGKYKIPQNTKDNYSLIKVLRGGQMAIKLTFHNFRVKEQLAAYLGNQIETDSLEIIGFLNNADFLAKYGYTPENVMAAFIPNTYEIYWHYTFQKFWERMMTENKKFWTEERLQKAKALNLTPIEVYTLASIVECESQYKPERPRIAGVYLNRLKTEGWKLEADPTVVFAVGDFSLKRVLERHLQTDSPYNTYKYAGLPPGPIYMSSINSIDAVLNAETHNYMFFCAKPHEAGQPHTHAFAETLNGHLKNAKVYWNWLKSNG